MEEVKKNTSNENDEHLVFEQLADFIIEFYLQFANHQK